MGRDVSVVVDDGLASYGRKKLSTQDNYIPSLDTPDPHKQSTPATTTSHNVPVAPQYVVWGSVYGPVTIGERFDSSLRRKFSTAGLDCSSIDSQYSRADTI